MIKIKKFTVIFVTAVFSFKNLVNDYATSIKVKIQLHHFRSLNNPAKLSLKYFKYSEILLILINIRPHFWLFSTCFFIRPIWYREKLFQNFRHQYLGKMWEIGAMELTKGGPYTHDDPHETGAARTAARPLLVQKNHFRNCQKFLNSWLKGGQKKKRGRMKLLLMLILKYFTEINYIFWQHQYIVEIKFLNWYKTHFSWMLKKNNKLFSRKKNF